MNAWQKFGIGAGVAAALAGGTWLAVWQINKGVVTVQTAPAARQDLTSIVTASGEVKPLTYTNVLGEGIGKITAIAVKEGDHVKKGDVLLKLESVQPAADVDAQRAGIAAAEAGVTSAGANDVSSQADVKSRAADLEHAKLDWERGQLLFKGGLIPKRTTARQPRSPPRRLARIKPARSSARRVPHSRRTKPCSAACETC
jgi:HlyD family secretion protein